MNNQGVTPEELELLLAGPAHEQGNGHAARYLAILKEFLGRLRGKG